MSVNGRIIYLLFQLENSVPDRIIIQCAGHLEIGISAALGLFKACIAYFASAVVISLKQNCRQVIVKNKIVLVHGIVSAVTFYCYGYGGSELGNRLLK